MKLFEDLPSVSNTKNSIEILSLNVLEGVTYDTEQICQNYKNKMHIVTYKLYSTHTLGMQ